MIVSDGKDTCQPPSPCAVAQEISKGGVIMRIQAIGFNVDQDAKRELECIANAGGGVYREAEDAASLEQELRILSTRTLRQYVTKGAPVKGGETARTATPVKPGRYLDKLLPGPGALVRDRPRPRRDAEGDRLVHRRPARGA